MADLVRFRNFVNGQSRESATGRWLASTNPYTGAEWAEVPHCGVDDVNDAIEAAHQAFTKGPWATLNATARGKLLRRLGDLIARDAEKLAAIEVRDNGKLLAEMAGQLRYIPEWFYYYGGLADKIEGGVLPTDKPDMFTYTKREPLGVVVAITPWNSPLLLLTWKLAPALAAGNTIVIKPSEFTSCSTLALMELVQEAGFPDGVINTVTGFGSEIGAALVEHPACRQGRVHRRRCDRGGGLRGGGEGHQARHARTRRQVAEHRLRRRQHRRCREGRHLRHLRGLRPDLHRGLASSRAALRL